jgi:hypothetical protein
MHKVGAVAYGGMLGFFNTLFIAVGVGSYGGGSGDTSLGIGIIVFMFGIVPALVTGMSLGAVAAATDRKPVAVRCAILALPAIAVLLGMAELFDLARMFLLAAIPTVVCALVLERRTRYVAPVPLAVIK